MKTSLNGHIRADNLVLPSKNRALLFGDGMFETIIYKNGTLRFFDDHFERLTKGLSELGISIEPFSKEGLASEIKELCFANGLSQARIKVICWRKAGNMVGYNGESNEFDYHITTLATEAPRFQMIKSLGLAHTVRLVNSMTSAFKTLSSLPYVLASNEKNNSHFGELVLTDTDLNVSECTSSNIFWIEDDRLFTPPLETGCVDGIMRKQIKESFHVIEQSVTYPELSNKKVIFSTNVAQLSVYKTIDNHKLSLQHPLIIKIKQLWEL